MAILRQGEGSVTKGLTSAQIAAKAAAARRAAAEAAQKAAILASKKAQAAKKPITAPVTNPVGTIGSSALKIKTPPSVNQNAYANPNANVVAPVPIPNAYAQRITAMQPATYANGLTPIPAFDKSLSSTQNANAYANPNANIATAQPSQGSFTPDGNKSAAMAASETGVSQAEINAADYIPQTTDQNLDIINPSPTEIRTGAGTETGFGADPSKQTSSGSGIKTTTGGSGARTSTGSSTSTGTGSGAKTGTGTGTGTDTGGTAQVQPWQEYFNKANTMDFAYDPANDNAYKQAASALENQVTQMMVGRGGLYSSVAQSALTSRLIDLQVTYQKQAHDNFLTEREYYMKAASFIAGRSDAEFNKNMTIAKFEADMQQTKFDNSLKTAQLQLSRANASHSRQVSNANSQQKNAQFNLAVMAGNYSKAKSQYDTLSARWSKEKAADYEVAKYFGVYVGSDINNYQNKLYQAQTKLESTATQVASYAQSVGDSKTYLEALNGFQSEKAQAASTKADYDSAYSLAYSNVVSALRSNIDAQTVLTDIATEPQRSDYISQLGTVNYNKLLAYVDGKID